MSKYGFEIRNGNKEVVVDGVNDNYMLWFVQTVKNTFNPSFNRYGGYGDSFTAIMPPCFSPFPEKVTTKEPPVVCGYSLYGSAVFGYCTGVEYAWDGFVWFGGWEAGSNYPDLDGARSVSSAMKVAVFSRNGSPQRRGNYGIQIVKNGGVVYDSRSVPFIPVGQFAYKRYGTHEGRSLTGSDGYANYLPSNATAVVDRVYSQEGWPLLSSLTQRVIPGLDGVEFAGNKASAIMAMSVYNENNTYVYKFVSLAHGVHSVGYANDGNLWFGFGGNGKDQGQLYNTGGGQGAYNLIAFAKIPNTFR